MQFRVFPIHSTLLYAEIIVLYLVSIYNAAVASSRSEKIREQEMQNANVALQYYVTLSIISFKVYEHEHKHERVRHTAFIQLGSVFVCVYVYCYIILFQNVPFYSMKDFYADRHE